MNPKTSTRKDVAALAGVSETIVSYVLNDNRYVAKDKRNRVLKAVQELNYKPNSIARALKGKPSSHILFIADNIASEYFGSLVSEMDNVAYDQGYLISLMRNRNSADFVSRVISRQPDGVVISSVFFQEKHLQVIADSGIPVVLLGNRAYQNLDSRITVIEPGLQEGMCSAVQLLIDRGRHNIIYIDRISQHGNFSDFSDLRYRGFCDRMEMSHLPFSRDSIFTGYSSQEELLDALVHRFSSGAKIDGIIARNDELAAVALAATRECSLAVPDEISIVGFDNSRISRLTSPKLTTVEIDRVGMAQAIITALHGMIMGGEPVVQTFKTTLLEREST